MKDFVLKIKKLITKLKELMYASSLAVIEKIKSININKEDLIKIVIPVTIICIGFFSCSFLQRNIKRNINDIFIISDDIRAYFSNKPDYWGLSTNYVVKNTIVDKKFIYNDKIILTDGKELLIGKGINGDVVLPREMSFDIILKKLNKSQCISYLENKLNDANQMKLESLSVVNSTISKVFTWGDKTNSLPVKPYTGKDICSDENNTLIWSVR